MQDLIVEEILRAPSFRERIRTRRPIETVIPPANRYPHKLKRAELERGRQPWAQSVVNRNQYSNSLRYS